MRDVCVEEWSEKKEKKKFFFWLMGWHGRAMPPQARPVPTFWKNSGFFFQEKKNIFFSRMWWVWFLVNVFKKISLFRIIFGQIPTKQIKTNKIKAIKLVGCLPRRARLKSLAWRLEGGFSTRYPIFHKETRVSNWHSLPNHMCNTPFPKNRNLIDKSE